MTEKTVVDTHHNYLQSELPILNQFVSKIAMVHGPRDEMLFDLEEHFNELKAILEEYLARVDNDTSDQDPPSSVEDLKFLKGKVCPLLKKMREMTSDYSLPEHACRTYTMTFTKLEELESNLFKYLLPKSE